MIGHASAQNTSYLVTILMRKVDATVVLLPEMAQTLVRNASIHEYYQGVSLSLEVRRHVLNVEGELGVRVVLSHSFPHNVLLHGAESGAPADPNRAEGRPRGRD